MKKLIRPAVLLLALLFMYAPILILALYSFTSATQIGAIRGFSLHNYVTLFTTEELRNMIIGTVLLALAAAVIATILGTLGAVGAFYSKKRTASAISAMNQIPVINADVVTGFSICILLVVVFGISKDTYIPLLIGHVTLCAPFVYLSVIPKLKQMDPSLYEAALDLGATPVAALWKVVFPQIYSGIAAGFALAITLSLDDYFIATYTKPAVFDTISTYVVNATKGAQTDIKTALWALSTVIFVLVVLIVLGMNIRANREAARRSGIAKPKRRGRKGKAAAGTAAVLALAFTLGSMAAAPAPVYADDNVTVIRVANWEEYIDLGDWDDDELIELESGDVFGERSMIDDFEDWYYETYGRKVKVEYSTFGTNEDLYNMLTLRDHYDL
ncbi:MAG: ABC transporter permease subunit, partial [Clostridia bacterium]|nr:ABC transporter permease subunit [Clostridia bacterium]